MDRREFLGGAAAAVAAASITPDALADCPPPRRVRQPPIGRGGSVTGLDDLHRLAVAHGQGAPIAFLDLAAVDQNLAVLTSFGAQHGMAVRPALKSFRSPRFSGYVLQRLPEPRGLIFNLGEVEGVLAHAPARTDLMTGYAPTFGEVAAYLGRPGPRRLRSHTVRLLIDSVPLAQRIAALARSSPRRLPIDVAVEFDVGMGKGGIGDEAELSGVLDVLRAHRHELRLGAVLGYDGHATLNGDANYRRLVAAQAQDAYRRLLAALEAGNHDLYDPATLIRNGPASSNYRNWAGGPANEMSPGSAILRAGYLDGGFDTEGLAPALTIAGAVRRITSDHPSVPVTGTTPPGASEMEIVVQGVGPAEQCVRPGGARADDLSGGGDAWVVPKGSVSLGDYVLLRPTQSETGIQVFDALTVVREGGIVRRWEVVRRPG